MGEEFPVNDNVSPESEARTRALVEELTGEELRIQQEIEKQQQILEEVLGTLETQSNHPSGPALLMRAQTLLTTLTELKQKLKGAFVDDTELQKLAARYAAIEKPRQ